jgi:hypothetical protein
VAKKKKEEYNPSKSTTETTPADPSSYDPKRGEGKFTTVDLGANLDQTMATRRKSSRSKMYFLPQTNR